ncbi:hypothetical protein KUC74_09440 [Pseudomonas aeruginosa]|uniref:hypothetical protein n=1 Tax=Pseudomonas aeruginosa TaxID=287 RepID=UPI001F427ACE|nr:hypothetical protein [Pseudomonas aeruginosa]MCF1244937.1 hypothetical protein [Pseudomonas aeruginosa]MCV0071170.1 hypothetical protein [Pseudomonas aeruginosa]
MMKHTPGPWYRDGTTVYALNPHNFNRFSAQIHGAHTPKSELEAVAQLMQAAPELLEALTEAAEILWGLGQIGSSPTALEKSAEFKSLITKATA